MVCALMELGGWRWEQVGRQACVSSLEAHPPYPPGQAQTLCVCIHRLHGTPGRGPNNTEDTAARELHIFPSEQPGNPFLNMPVGRLPPGVQCRSDGILVMSSGHVLLPSTPAVALGGSLLHSNRNHVESNLPRDRTHPSWPGLARLHTIPSL